MVIRQNVKLSMKVSPDWRTQEPNKASGGGGYELGRRVLGASAPLGCHPSGDHDGEGNDQNHR